eukprot:SAG22_NODE_458_length_10257_cov_4.533373_6_plen_161_part_00
MSAAAETTATGGFIELYFYAFILACSLLFFNIIAGVIISAFEVVDVVREWERAGRVVTTQSFTNSLAGGDVEAKRATSIDLRHLPDRTVLLQPSTTRSLFRHLDTYHRHANQMNKAELQAELAQQFGLPNEQTAGFFERLDIDQDGMLSTEEIELASAYL